MPEATLHPAADKHEERDVERRKLLLFAAAFCAVILIAISVLWLAIGRNQGHFSAAQPLGHVADDSELQQRDQLSRYLAAQHAELERLAWTDASKRSAKLPIEDAMALLARKGAAR